MATEKIPLKISFELSNKLDNDELPLPRATIKFNDIILDENVELDNPNNETALWQTDKKISIKQYEVEIDDDEENNNTISIIFESSEKDVWDLLEDNPETGGKSNYGIVVKDIEINEISIESLIWQLSNVMIPICPESEFETDGFIQWHRENNLMDSISIVDGTCVSNSQSTYMHASKGTTYTIGFKTPLYLWLLEELLQ